MAIHKRLKHFSIVHAKDAMFCSKKRKLEWNNVLKGCREKKLNDWFNTTLRNAFALHAIRAWTFKKNSRCKKLLRMWKIQDMSFLNQLAWLFHYFFFFFYHKYFIWSRTLALTNIKSIFWPCDEVCVFNESFARFLHSRTLQSIII